MTLNQFVAVNEILPGDAVIAKKKTIGFLDHYIIYLGIQDGEHKFIANYTNGVRILSYKELWEFSADYSPKRIRRFMGNEVQRRAAVARALSLQDQNSYHLILNNCEHYANYVQHGKLYSQQTKVFGVGMAATGLAVATSSKNERNKEVGAVITVFGLLTLLLDEI